MRVIVESTIILRAFVHGARSMIIHSVRSYVVTWSLHAHDTNHRRLEGQVRDAAKFALCTPY